MDLKIKICGLLLTIVLTIKFIHGRDVFNVAYTRRVNKNNRNFISRPPLFPRTKLSFDIHSYSMNQSGSPSQKHLKQVLDKKGNLKLNNQDTETPPLLKDQDHMFGFPLFSKSKLSFNALNQSGSPSPDQKHLKQVLDKIGNVTINNQDPEMQKLKMFPVKTSRLPFAIPGIWGGGNYAGPKDVVPMNQPLQAWLPSQGMVKFESAAPSHSPYATTFTAEWPLGIVPYFIDVETNDENLKRRIQKAMALVEASSCVIFEEINDKPEDGYTTSWLHFTNPNQQRECSHDTIEGQNNDIIIVLGIECLKTSDFLHSVLHGLGFKDEVSHPHRDQYIRILWENVQPRYRPLFRVRRDKAPYKLVEYDPMSIMHFHDRAFSENGGLTIAPVMLGLVINPSDNLSQLDVMKLRIMFGHECNKRKVGNLIDNCKNVLYKQNTSEQFDESNNEDAPAFVTIYDHRTQLNAEKNDDQEVNAEGGDVKKLDAEEDGHKQSNATKDDDQEVNADGGDVKKLDAEEDYHKQSNAEPDDIQHLNAEDEDDQHLHPLVDDGIKKLKAEANKTQQLKANNQDEDGEDHKKLSDNIQVLTTTPRWWP